MILYEGNMNFEVNEEEVNDGGWTWDCCKKRDYDPTIVHLSCRVWPDASYTYSLYVGDYIIVDGPIMKAETVECAKSAVEKWAKETADRIESAIRNEFLTTVKGT